MLIRSILEIMLILSRIFLYHSVWCCCYLLFKHPQKVWSFLIAVCWRLSPAYLWYILLAEASATGQLIRIVPLHTVLVEGLTVVEHVKAFFLDETQYTSWRIKLVFTWNHSVQWFCCMRYTMWSPFGRRMILLNLKALHPFLGHVELVTDRWTRILFRVECLLIYAFGRFDYFSWLD